MNRQNINIHHRKVGYALKKENLSVITQLKDIAIGKRYNSKEP